ncbi:hypothetical protein Scani_29400 [Streptomyces caniferus]|uniref:Uncharacterized protein n=1 Tax=Streptomyces caniferus TaxID=285557 RepID=A0A640S7U9_9ACTN|nr:hypothetical protein Scani_29400 [Streptomyces caniferus]
MGDNVARRVAADEREDAEQDGGGRTPQGPADACAAQTHTASGISPVEECEQSTEGREKKSRPWRNHINCVLLAASWFLDFLRSAKEVRAAEGTVPCRGTACPSPPLAARHHLPHEPKGAP